jgi:hypothetical protein
VGRSQLREHVGGNHVQIRGGRRIADLEAQSTNKHGKREQVSNRPERTLRLSRWGAGCSAF